MSGDSPFAGICEIAGGRIVSVEAIGAFLPYGAKSGRDE
jgi:hypothetical protein